MEQGKAEALLACPRCGRGDFRPHLDATDHTVSNEPFTIQTCTFCGLAATTPRPLAQHIGRYYESTDYISHTNSSRGVVNVLYQWARSIAVRKKHRLLARHIKGGQVLDVGCGTGEFLGYLKSRGYQTQGVEPSLTAREQAIANHALAVVPALEQVPTHEQFHAITLWHVLEHLYDPHTTLLQLHARARKGALLIIAVPDRDSWDAGYYGAAWAAYDVPRHLYHYRISDIDALLQAHGFTVVDTRPMWMDALYVSMLSERNAGGGALSSLLKGVLIGSWSNLIALLSKRPTSSTLYIAQKA